MLERTEKKKNISTRWQKAPPARRAYFCRNRDTHVLLTAGNTSISSSSSTRLLIAAATVVNIVSGSTCKIPGIQLLLHVYLVCNRYQK